MGVVNVRAALVEQMAQDNVALHRRVIEMEEQDRQRLARIAWLKLENERLRAELDAR